MKIKIDIDCTPKEVRDFFGMPDVAPMQERLMREVEERLQGALGAMEGTELWKALMPMAAPFATKGGMEGFDFEKMRRFFWPSPPASKGGDKDREQD